MQGLALKDCAPFPQNGNADKTKPTSKSKEKSKSKSPGLVKQAAVSTLLANIFLWLHTLYIRNEARSLAGAMIEEGAKQEKRGQANKKLRSPRKDICTNASL